MDSYSGLLAGRRSSPGWGCWEAAHDDENMLIEVVEGQSVGQRRQCNEKIQTFWSLTTNIEYLSSEWSRRRLLRFVLPLATITFLVIDMSCNLSGDQSTSKYLIAGLEVGLFLIFLVVGMLPMHSIWIDVVVVASLLSYTMFHRSVVQDDVPIEVLWTLLLFQSGVRSCFVLAYGLISSMYLCIFNRSLGILALSYVVIAMVSEAAGTDYKMAAMWAELQENKSALAFLLDHASCGFCTVNPNSGLIRTASTSLKRSLKTSSLHGVSLVDLMHLKEKSAQEFHSMCSTAAAGAIPQPAHVTCQIKDLKFSAKMIPYRASQDRLEICFQMKSVPAAIEGTTSESLSTPESLYLLSTTSEEDISWDVTPPAQQVLPMRQERGVQTEFIETESRVKISSLHPSGVPSLPRPEVTFYNSSRQSRSTDGASSSSSSGIGDDCSRGRRRSRGKRHFQVSVDQDSNGEVIPQLEIFAPTKYLTCIRSAQWLFKHWNLPKEKSSCCPWHASLKIVISLLESEMSGACDPFWSPLTAWQCGNCTSMNKDNAALCQLCGGESPSNASNHTKT